MATRQSFVVARDDLRRTRIVDEPLPALADGEVLLRIDRFAFTANNITYAEMGERMSYWRFFAAPDGWGLIPVWGFAEVVDTRTAPIRRGERIYGFLPMATHVLLRADRVSDSGFVDGSAHRQQLPPAYNLYLRSDADAIYRTEHEGLLALLRPVFITSFLIDDYLADENFFGAKRVVISSASAKTAFGLAHQLHRRGSVEIVGLTSPANRAFVAGLGCYDRVLTYDDVPSLPADAPTVFVDFAGSAALRTMVHAHLGDQLVFSSAVGFSHRDRENQTEPTALPGAKPVFFFAPDRLRKRAKDWGRDGVDARFGEQWRQFVPVVSRWLTVTHGNGVAAVEAVYTATLDGKVAPDQGHVLSLHETPS